MDDARQLQAGHHHLDPRDIAVVIPALNEALRIRGVVEGALAQCTRVIVVDDGSDDDTVARLADLPITLLRHPRRMGKGASLRDGFHEALRNGARAVLTMDGDGQHQASDIPRMLAAANRYPGHIVIGARLRKRSQQPVHRRLANEFGDWGIAWGTGYQVADSQSGQRLYPAEVAALDDVPGEAAAEHHHVTDARHALVQPARCMRAPSQGASNSPPGSCTSGGLARMLRYTDGSPPWRSACSTIWLVIRHRSRSGRKWLGRNCSSECTHL